MTRVCKCGCEASLDGMRANALYHSNACRMRAIRAQNANGTRTRRPSRNGKGVRIYIAPGDTVDTIVAKGIAAMERELARRGA